LVRQQTAIPLLPVEISRLADPGLAADLRHRRAFLTLLQDERLLRLRELRCLHRLPTLFRPGKRTGKLQLQTIQFSGGRASTNVSPLLAMIGKRDLRLQGMRRVTGAW